MDSICHPLPAPICHHLTSNFPNGFLFVSTSSILLATMQVVIRSSVQLSALRFVCRFVRSSLRLFVRSSVILFVCSCVYPFIRSSDRPFVLRPFVRSSVRLSSFIRSCDRPFVLPFVRSSVCPIVRSPYRPFVRSSICRSRVLSFHIDIGPRALTLSRDVA